MPVTVNTGEPDLVSQRLQMFVAEKAAESARYGDEAALFVRAATATIAGGKRLRSRFALTGWSAVAGAEHPHAPVPEFVADAGAALEIFHAAALVHDDIIDNSDTRRGRPATHRSLEAFHRDAGWQTDPTSFGRSAAILVGDLLVAWSDDLAEDAFGSVADAVARAARAEYALMRREVTLGQFLDIAEESAFRAAPDDQHADRALRVASLKSARYSVQQPLVIGASLAGAEPDQLDALRAFGHPVGLAFQLRDDVLGVFGEASETGKPAGDDLREGKRTVLIAFAREGLAAPARRILDELLGDPELEGTQIASLQRTIADSGALDKVEALITRYVHDADRALSGARLKNSEVSALRDLARAATIRIA